MASRRPAGSGPRPFTTAVAELQSLSTRTVLGIEGFRAIGSPDWDPGTVYREALVDDEPQIECFADGRWQRAPLQQAMLASAARQHTASKSRTRLFVSHSSADVEIAKELVQLIDTVLTVPRDSLRCTSVPGYKLEPGADGPEELRDNLQSAKVVLGVLTNNSLDSSFVLLELGAAWGLRTRIVPLVAGVRFGAIPSPIGPDTHAVDVSDASGMASVIESIARRCDMPQRCDAAQLHDAIARFAVRVAALAGPKESPETPAAAGGLTAGELADDIGFLEGYLDHIVKIDEAHSEIRKVRPSIAFVVSGNRPPPGPSPALQEAKRRRDELGDYLERHRLRAYALVQRATGERPTWNGPELREGLVARAKADVGAALGWFQELAKRAR